MGDAAAAILDDLVTRPYGMLARAELDLLGPSETWQQFAEVDREGRKRCNQLGDRYDLLLPHRVEADPSGRNRNGMAVLEPQHDLLAGGRCRKAGVAVRRPCVRVMRARKRPICPGAIAASKINAGIAERVEGIFYDIVSGCADDVEKQLTAEFGQAEASPDFTAVENDRLSRRSEALAPLCEDLTITGKQHHPTGDRSGAVTRPVIHRHEPGMQAVGIAKKSKIRSEIQLVEIGAGVGQPIRRDAHGVEAEDLCPCGEIGLELSNRALSVKRGDEHRAGP